MAFRVNDDSARAAQAADAAADVVQMLRRKAEALRRKADSADAMLRHERQNLQGLMELVKKTGGGSGDHAFDLAKTGEYFAASDADGDGAHSNAAEAQSDETNVCAENDKDVDRHTLFCLQVRSPTPSDWTSCSRRPSRSSTPRFHAGQRT